MKRYFKTARLLTFLVILVLGGPGGSELSRYYKQRHVLDAPQNDVSALGRHLIVGYRRASDILVLIDRQAIAGVFLTARNIRGRSREEIQREIRLFQERQLQRNGRPLIIASDQEGGIVSRLSPPLPQMPPLAEVVLQSGHGGALESNVAAYAMQQARELRSLGVNVNFGPVVDLADKNDAFPEDEYSLLYLRAISPEPRIAAAVASIYCKSMQGLGVLPTLKHFPGLGRIRVDTHRYVGRLTGSIEQLELSEWLPFRRAAAESSALIMLGHVKVSEVDDTYPASSSYKVIDGIIRRRWGFEGILITDDFAMGAVQFGKGGAGGAAVRSLNAGADLILLGQIPDQFFPVVSALLEAKRSGALNEWALVRSEERLQRVQGIVSPNLTASRLGAGPGNQT